MATVPGVTMTLTIIYNKTYMGTTMTISMYIDILLDIVAPTLNLMAPKTGARTFWAKNEWNGLRGS